MSIVSSPRAGRVEGDGDWPASRRLGPKPRLLEPIAHPLLAKVSLGRTLARFDPLRRQHEAEATGTARKALADPHAYDLAALNDPRRKVLIHIWKAWQEEKISTTPSAGATPSRAGSSIGNC